MKANFIKPQVPYNSFFIFPIIFFHSEQDKNLPVQLAKKMVAKLPNSKLITFKDEAHLSTLCNHFPKAAMALREKDIIDEIIH